MLWGMSERRSHCDAVHSGAVHSLMSLADAGVTDGCSLLIQLGADVQARGDDVWVRRASHCEG